jgi:SAM-dependent methyltransferase
VKKKRRSDDAQLGRALDLLEERRAPYSALLARLVADTLAAFPPAPDGPIVELGAGAGQLRAWLPPALAARAVHTDPSEPALRALAARAPEAATRVASAAALPFANGACGAVLALDVLDAVADEQAAVAEAARVLAPGGRFVHFLDMATLLERPFAKLAASGLVPIPNVFGDPGDHEWPLDVLLLPREWLAGLLDRADAAAHPFAAAFGATFEPWFAPRFDAAGATQAFQAVGSSGDRRRALAASLVAAARLAQAGGYPPLAPLPFHSGKYLKSILDTTFAESGAFEVEASAIVARAAAAPRTDPAVRYRSLCVGHQRILDALPARLLADDAPATTDDETLVEAAMFVFVARRT